MIDLEATTIEGTVSYMPEVAETIKVIITTPKGTVVFDRNFGIDMTILDEPINLVQGLLIVEMIKQIQLYEPRVRVKEITFTIDENNNLFPKVRVE